MMDATANPYVGPRTFEEHDSHLFFGREREARELLWMVMSEPLVLFYAQSGSGKSSLINTRLVPGLREEGFQVLPIGRVGGELPEGITKVGNVFVFNLLLSLDQGGWGSTTHISHFDLSDFLSGPATEGQSGAESDTHKGDQQGRALIIDQFEELFTTHLEHRGKRRGFFWQLGQAMRRDPMLWVVLVIRQDYVAALDPYARTLPGKLRARFHMRRMRCPAALEAVTKPAASHGRPFAPGVAESLVDNLRQIRVQEQAEPCLGEFIEPVQLQVACYQLWENLKARPPGEITEQDLQQLGDVDAALAQFYEEAIAQVLAETGGSEIELREWFARQLITEAGTRGTVYQGTEQTGGLANQTVQSLANQFLLRAEVRAGGTWYELVHDRFVEPILSANEAWRWRQSWVVQAALAWEASGRGDEELYQGQQLQAALARLRGQQVEPLVAEFLDASQKLDQAREERRAQRWRELELEQARRLAEEAEARERAETAARQEAEARAAEQAQSSRRLRRLAAGLAAVFVVALAAAILAGAQRQQAVAQKSTAEAASTAEVAQRNTAEAASTAEVAQKITAEAASTAEVAQKITAEAARTAEVAQKITAEAARTAEVAQKITAEAARTAEVAQKITAEAARTAEVAQQATAEAAKATSDAGGAEAEAIALGMQATAAYATEQALGNQEASLYAQLTAAAATPACRTATPSPPPTATPDAAALQRQLTQVRATQTAVAAGSGCTVDPQGEFRTIWEEEKSKLGCPQQVIPITSFAAAQAFEEGWMVWREDNARIYAIYKDTDSDYIGSWEDYPDAWVEGDPEFSCPDDAPSQSPPTPKRGFGKIWCDYDEVRQGLGPAIEAERGFDAVVQEFEYGFVLRTEEGRWIFYGDRSWQLLYQMVVENAEGIESDQALGERFQINSAGGENECSLSLVGPPHTFEGTKAISLQFHIKDPSPSDFCGFDRILPSSQNWSGYAYLCLWVEIDGPVDQLVVQFSETSGEVWKKRTDRNSVDLPEFCIPLSTSTFSQAEWSAPGNGQIDLDAINYYGFYMHGPQNAQGTIYVDNLRIENR